MKKVGSVGFGKINIVSDVKQFPILFNQHPFIMKKILGSVGFGGTNTASDVKLIQTLLNQHPFTENKTPLKVDGIAGLRTVDRIKAFQKDIVKISRPDGRVDPNGKTVAFLYKNESSAKAVTTYEISKKGLDLLKAVEGLRLKTYDDQTGKGISAWIKGATIGYGHLISQSEWDTYKKGIDSKQAETLLKKDISPYVKAVNSEVTSALKQYEFDALVILSFNIGLDAFKTSSVLKLVNNPSAKTNYTNLETAWKAWNKSQGKKMQGLVNRRNAEWNIYNSNIYKKW